jgi:hypothetical protein
MSKNVKKPLICRRWTTKQPWQSAPNSAVSWLTELKRSTLIVVEPSREWARETYSFVKYLNEEAERRCWQLKFSAHRSEREKEFHVCFPRD